MPKRIYNIRPIESFSLRVKMEGECHLSSSRAIFRKDVKKHSPSALCVSNQQANTLKKAILYLERSFLYHEISDLEKVGFFFEMLKIKKGEYLLK